MAVVQIIPVFGFGANEGEAAGEGDRQPDSFFRFLELFYQLRPFLPNLAGEGQDFQPVIAKFSDNTVLSVCPPHCGFNAGLFKGYDFEAHYYVIT